MVLQGCDPWCCRTATPKWRFPSAVGRLFSSVFVTTDTDVEGEATGGSGFDPLVLSRSTGIFRPAASLSFRSSHRDAEVQGEAVYVAPVAELAVLADALDVAAQGELVQRPDDGCPVDADIVGNVAVLLPEPPAGAGLLDRVDQDPINGRCAQIIVDAGAGEELELGRRELLLFRRCDRLGIK